jgi:hypothetical protein
MRNSRYTFLQLLQPIFGIYIQLQHPFLELGHPGLGIGGQIEWPAAAVQDYPHHAAGYIRVNCIPFTFTEVEMTIGLEGRFGGKRQTVLSEAEL